MGDAELRPQEAADAVVKPSKGRIAVVIGLVVLCGFMIFSGLSRVLVSRDSANRSGGPTKTVATTRPGSEDEQMRRLEVLREMDLSRRSAERVEPHGTEPELVQPREGDFREDPFAASAAAPAPDPRRSRFEAARNGSLSWSGSSSTWASKAVPQNFQGTGGAGAPPAFPSLPPELLQLAMQGRSVEQAPPAPPAGVERRPGAWNGAWRMEGKREAGRALREGTVVEVQLLGAIQTDLGTEGVVRVQVRRDVLFGDGATAIPRGSVLVGGMGEVTAASGGRVALGFRSLSLPDGTRFEVPESILSEPDGSAGASGRVNRHIARTLGSALLLGLVSAGFELGRPDRNSQSFPTDREVAAGEVSRELSRVASAMIGRSLEVRPTVFIRAGTVLTMVTDRPLLLD